MTKSKFWMVLFLVALSASAQAMDRNDEGRDAAAEACSAKAGPALIAQCLKAVGQAYYLDIRAAMTCRDTASSLTITDCLHAMANRQYTPKEAEACRHASSLSVAECMASAGRPAPQIAPCNFSVSELRNGIARATYLFDGGQYSESRALLQQLYAQLATCQ